MVSHQVLPFQATETRLPFKSCLRSTLQNLSLDSFSGGVAFNSNAAVWMNQFSEEACTAPASLLCQKLESCSLERRWNILYMLNALSSGNANTRAFWKHIFQQIKGISPLRTSPSLSPSLFFFKPVNCYDCPYSPWILGAIPLSDPQVLTKDGLKWHISTRSFVVIILVEK